MKQVLVSNQGITVAEVPAPRVEPGTVLVRIERSCISVGTEMSGVRSSNTPLWKRAMQQPEQVMRVARMALDEGIVRTRDLVRTKLEARYPMGYSAAGRVIAVGEGISDISVGDRVACAGAQSAHHAEVVCVARNLAVPIPDGLDVDQAATVTLGAIALQGVRRAAPTLGETFVVVGLGLIGQLTEQILRANGIRVIGIDLERGRIRRALLNGMDQGVHPDDGNEVEHTIRLTDGIGADAVMVTAATPSSALISRAFQMCRRKARVVLVGDVGLELNREDIYRKELDFLVSTSYGPGRYDRLYEEKGLEYPVAYVRWTENRNMAAYLRLLAEGRVNVESLLDERYPIERASDAYAALSDPGERPLATVLEYAGENESVVRRVANPVARQGRSGAIRLAVVGAGGFAKSTHLPNLQSLTDDYHLRAIVSRHGHNAMSVARQFGAEYGATDLEEVLADPEVDAVLIATRHDLHGPMVLRALGAGKHVFVEKPLCLSPEELEKIQSFYDTAGDAPPVLLCGFNRRFSRFAESVVEVVARRSNPMILNYRVNAGYLPGDVWVHTSEGGGRNLGEACHFYDLFTFFTQSRVSSVTATAIRPRTDYYRATDNFVAVLRFEEGSVATLTYTALGNISHPKELLDIYADGKVVEVIDFQELRVTGGKHRPISIRVPDKGHRAQLKEFARSVRRGGDWPIPLWQQVQATAIALDVQSQLEL